MIYADPITAIDTEKQTLTAISGKLLKYGSLIIAIGCTPSRFPEKIGGNHHGVPYIQDVADADSLISSLEKARKVVIFGGGYIGMEVVAAAVGWKLDTTVQAHFVLVHLRLLLLHGSMVSCWLSVLYCLKGMALPFPGFGNEIKGWLPGLKKVVIGIGAKPAVSPFEVVGLNTTVDGLFCTSIPGIFAVGDVVAFPLKLYDRVAGVEHVDHARRSAQHCLKALLSAQPHTVFEYEGSPSKVWWQFFGNSSEISFACIINTAYEFKLLSELARSQPSIDKAQRQKASSFEEALEMAKTSLIELKA
ncbi:hypothetical protein DITRI_Ditri04bG0130700 [Diplodiscus trichospermus]